MKRERRTRLPARRGPIGLRHHRKLERLRVDGEPVASKLDELAVPFVEVELVPQATESFLTRGLQLGEDSLRFHAIAEGLKFRGELP